MTWIFEVDYLDIEARTYSAERVGAIRQHRTAFVLADTLEQACAAVREWYVANHSDHYDFGEVWSVTRHGTSQWIDATQ
jgi:hypothetical protein